MTTECRCCGGRCGEVQPLELNRRDFLEKLAVGAAALAVAGQMAWADEGDKLLPPATPQSAGLRRYPLTPPRVYRGKNLEAVGMPLGGIGTGSIWLNGQGQLGIWQIFNNLSEPRVPDSFFAVRAKAACGPGGHARAADARRRRPAAGGIARLRRRLPHRPADLPRCGPAGRGRAGSHEPDDPAWTRPTRRSPARCFASRPRTRATRRSRSPSSATLQNAVGNPGPRASRACGSAATAETAIAWSAATAMTAVAMDKSADPVASGPVKVRSAAGQGSARARIALARRAAGLDAETADPWPGSPPRAACVLADGVSPAFFETLARLAAATRLQRRGHGLRRFREARPTKAGRSSATPSARAPPTAPSPGNSR